MPNKVESRIVTMTFDNAQFQKNVAATQKSLKELDESLEFKDADKSFSKITKAASQVSFSSLLSNIGTIGVAIEKSMSLGVKAMDRIKDKILDTGEHLIKAVANGITKPLDDAFNQIMTGGWNRATNIDKAKFQLAGLGVQWEEIEKDIDYGVSGTAYGLDSAARAAAQLVASQVELGDEMRTSLRGISGVAAMTGSSYDEIAHIFTKIAGNGRVMGDDLQSLSTRGMNAAATLASAMGTSEAAVREMVSNGEIDFATFAKAMDNAFGEHAKDANKTYEGAFDNMHAALSRTGEKFFTVYRANMVSVFNDLRGLFNAMNGISDPTKGLASGHNLIPLVETFDGIMRDIAEYVTEITTDIKTIFIDSGAWKGALEGVANVIEGVWSIITAVVSAFRPLKNGADGLVSRMEWFSGWAEEFREKVQDTAFLEKAIGLVQKFVDFLGSVKDLATDIFYDITDWFNIGFVIGDMEGGLSGIFGVIKTIVKFIGRFIDSPVFNTIIGFFRVTLSLASHVLGSIVGVISNVVRAISNAFNVLRTQLGGIGKDNPLTRLTEAFWNLGDVAHEVIEWIKPSKGFFVGLTKVFSGVFSVIKVVSEVFATLGNVASHLFFAIFGKADKVFTGFWNKLGDGIGWIGDLLTRFSMWIIESDALIKTEQVLCNVIDVVVEAVKKAITWIKNAAITVYEWGKIAVDWVKNMANAFNDFVKRITGYSIGEIFSNIGDVLTNIWEKVKGFFGNIPNLVQNAKDKYLEWSEAVKNSSIGTYFETIKETVSDLWEKVKEFFSEFSKSKEIDEANEKMSPFAKTWETLKTAFSGVVKFFKAAWPVLRTVFESIASIVGSVFSTVADMISNINLDNLDLGGALTGGGALAGGAGLFILFEKISDLVESLTKGVGAFTGEKGFFSNINGVLSSVKDTLVAYQAEIKAETILTIAKAVAILAASLFVLALVDPERIAIAGMAVAGLLDTLGSVVEKLYNTAGNGDLGTDKGFAAMSASMLLIAGAILLLSFATARLAKVPVDDLLVGLGALHVILMEVRSTIESMSKVNDTKVTGIALMLLMIGVTVNKMVKPIKALGEMNIMTLIQGIVALKVVLMIISDTFEMLDKASKTWSSADAMKSAVNMIKSIALSLALMIIPVKMFGVMNPKQLGIGLLAVVALIGVMTLAMKILMTETEKLTERKNGNKLTSSKNGGLEGVAAALLSLAATIILLMIPIKMLAAMGKEAWVPIAQIGVIILGLLGMLALFNKYGGSSKDALLAGVALAELAVVVWMLIPPIKALTELGADAWTGIAQLGVLLAGMLLFLGLFNHFGGSSKDAMLTGVAIAIVAGALMLLLVPLKQLMKLGNGAWNGILETFVILGGVLAILAFFGKDSAKALMTMSTVLIKIGLSVVLVGAGLMLMGLAFGIIAATAGPAGLALAAFLVAIVGSLPLLLTELFAAVGVVVEGIVFLIKGLVVGVLGIIKAAIKPALEIFKIFFVELIKLVSAVILQLVESIKTLVPAISQMLVEIEDDLEYDFIPALCRIVVTAIDTLLSVLAEHWPSIMESLRVLLDGLIQLLIDLTPRIGEWLNSLLQMLIDMLPKLRDLLINVCLLIIEVSPWLAAAVMALVESILSLVPTIIDDLVNALIAILDGIGLRSQEIVDSALMMLIRIIWAVLSGIWKVLGLAKDKIVELIGEIWPQVRDWFVDKWTEVKDWIQERVDAVKEAIGEKVQAIVDAVTAIWDKIVEFFTGIKETIVGWGKKIIGWFKGGVDDSTDELYEAGQNAGDSLVAGTQDSLDEHSPSGEGEDIGKYYDMGIVKGCDSYSELLAAAGSDLGDTLATNTNESLDTGLSLEPLDKYKEQVEGTNINPIVAPVMGDTSDITGRFTSLIGADGKMDMSSIWKGQEGSGLLNTLNGIQENQNNDTTASEVGSLRDELREFKDALELILNENTRTIVNDIAPRVSRLESAMYNMQVVMDTNAIVGQITPKIDESLGRRATYRGRGN